MKRNGMAIHIYQCRNPRQNNELAVQNDPTHTGTCVGASCHGSEFSFSIFETRFFASLGAHVCSCGSADSLEVDTKVIETRATRRVIRNVEPSTSPSVDRPPVLAFVIVLCCYDHSTTPTWMLQKVQLLELWSSGVVIELSSLHRISSRERSTVQY